MAEEYAMVWGAEATSNDKMIAAAAHLIPLFIPLLGIIGPIALYVLMDGKSKFIKYHAAQALAWQGAVWLLSATVLPILFFLTCGFGVLLLPLLLIPNLYGAYLAMNGQWQGFPAVEKFGR
jgi:uncharacterized membrane protein